MKNILVIATHNFEDTELIAVVDILRRKNHNVTIAYGVEGDYVNSQRGHKILVEHKLKDIVASDLSKFDVLYIPGGSGALDLDKFPETYQIINWFVKNDKVLAALCAGPTLLAKRGALDGYKAICYPNPEYLEILEKGGAIVENPDCKEGDNNCEVVVDRKRVTGLGMRSSILFGDTLVKVIEA